VKTCSTCTFGFCVFTVKTCEIVNWKNPVTSGRRLKAGSLPAG
jgi:hypothetical protein